MAVRIRLLIVLCGLLFVGNLALGATSVPNTFNTGEPAKASEVNENFSSVVSAIDAHWSRYPNRYYPNWRYAPTFYLELPSLGKYWKGRLNSEYGYATTSKRNLNFWNAYDSTDYDKGIWLGISLNPSSDADASTESKIVSGFSVEGRELGDGLYRISLSHHKDGVYASINYTQDSSTVYNDNAAFYYLQKDQILSLLSQLYELLKLNSDTVAVFCPTINFAMQADYTVKVTGDSCVETTNG